ncbi:Fasciclin-domain-containing protein [Wilcoxina mikolae CBS 423.85]|nr:Fasciclin-domain-containing protein [Wilcoxina mikolae CBS 423.85]
MQLIKHILPILSLACVTVGQTMSNLSSLLKDNSEDLQSLTETVSEYPDLLATLGAATNITILAPSNDAFKAFKQMEQYKDVTSEELKEVLTYHVLNGTYYSSAFNEKPRFLPTLLGEFQDFRNLSGASQVVKAIKEDGMAHVYGGLGMKIGVQKADLYFTGGVLHIIDSVIPPPMKVSVTAKVANLTSLAGALTEAKLVKTVDSMAGITVFAPTNDAFQAIGNLLTNLTTQQLTDILTYHVVSGAVAYSNTLKDNQEVETVNGGKLTIRIEGDGVFVNGARVIMADVLTNNGVVHVIDSVLNPNNTKDTPEPTAATQEPAFPSATAVSEDPYVSSSGTTTGAAPSATGGVGKLGISSVLAFVGAGAFAFGMIA